MEETVLGNRKTNHKPQSFIPIPHNRQKPNTATGVDNTRFSFDESETQTNNLSKSLSNSLTTRTTETSVKYTYTTYKDEDDSHNKSRRSSSLGQLSNYKFENILQRDEDAKYNTKVVCNEAGETNMELYEKTTDMEKSVKDLQLGVQKQKLTTLFDDKQRELVETLKEERNKQERFLALEIIKMEKKLREEFAHLTRKFDEERSALERYITQQLKEHLEQLRFEKDEKTTCQIDEFKFKQESKIQESLSIAFVALLISLLSILVTLVW